MEGELIRWGFGGLAEADLVGDEDAVAGGGETRCGVLPGGAAEVFTVEEDDGFRGGGVCGGGNVHVGHGEVEALGGEGVVVEGPWVGVVPDAGGDDGLGEGGGCHEGEEGEETHGGWDGCWCVRGWGGSREAYSGIDTYSRALGGYVR